MAGKQADGCLSMTVTMFKNGKDVISLIERPEYLHVVPKPAAKVEAPEVVNRVVRKPEEEGAGLLSEHPEKGIRKEELQNAVEKINEALADSTPRTHSRFRIHEGTGRVMVNLVDTRTDEVIREVPPEKILDLVANIWEMVGIIVDERG